MQSDSAQTDYVAAFLKAAAFASLLKYHMPLNQRQLMRIRERWASTYNIAAGRNQDRRDRRERRLHQTTSALYGSIGERTLRGVAESRICMVFGVPPLIVYAYVGLLRATYAISRRRGRVSGTRPCRRRLKWRDFWTWHLLGGSRMSAI